MMLKMETNSYHHQHLDIQPDPFSSSLPPQVNAAAADDVDQKTSLGFMDLLGFNNYYSSYMFDNTTAYHQFPPPPSSSLAYHSNQDIIDNGDVDLDRKEEITTVDEESSVVLSGQPPSSPNSSSICTSRCIKEKKAMVGDVTKAKKKKKEKAPRFAFMTRTDVDHLDDGYRWRKYGQKAVKNSRFPRSYFRCTSASCNVKKRVERCMDDPSYVITTYEGQHNHPPAASYARIIPSFNHLITPTAFTTTTAAAATSPAMLGLLQDMLPCHH